MVARNTIDNVCTWCDKEFKSERGVAIHQRICPDRPQVVEKPATADSPATMVTVVRPKSDPDDLEMLANNERMWMLKHRPAMFDREMDVQHFERKGKVEREAYEMQLRDRELRTQEAQAKVQTDAWDLERKGYVARIAALEDVAKRHTELMDKQRARVSEMEPKVLDLCTRVSVIEPKVLDLCTRIPDVLV